MQPLPIRFVRREVFPPNDEVSRPIVMPTTYHPTIIYRRRYHILIMGQRANEIKMSFTTSRLLGHDDAYLVEKAWPD